MDTLHAAAAPGRSRERVLVTGHRGFVGSLLVEHLLADGVDVVGVDAHWFRSGRGRAWQDVEAEELGSCDAVVHLGGIADDRAADADPDGARTIITDDTVDLARRCRAAGVTRFVFASSSAVYGRTADPVDEAHPTDPQSLYAAAKLDAETQVLALADGRFAPVALRFGSGFGWSPANRFDLVVNKMTLLGLRDGRIGSQSTGTSHRPFVHVADMAAAARHVLSIAVDGDAGACFNVVHPEGNRTIGEVLGIVAAETGAILDPPGTAVDPRDYRIDPAALLATGFTYAWPLERGVRSLAAHLRHRPVHDPLPWDRRATVERPAETGSASWPLVTPSALGEAEQRAYLADVAELTRSSRYRLVGGHTDRAAELVAEAFELPTSHRALLLRSGTDSLTLALQRCGVGAGDRVVVPDQAFHAVAATVLRLGAVPVLADIDPTDFNLSAAAVEKVLEAGGITAVVAVDNYGTPADWPALGDVCRSAGVPLVLDACESLGARRPDGPAITHVDLVAVSFSFTKPVHAAGMGGALLGPVDALDEVAADPRYLVRQTMLPELNAAYLVRAWPHLEDNIVRLRAVYDRYRAELEPRGLVAQAEHGRGTRLHAPFLVPADGPWTRDALLDALAAAGVGAAAQFPSQAHLLDLTPTSPVAADVAARVVSLPSGAGLDLGDAERIARTVGAVYDSIS